MSSVGGGVPSPQVTESIGASVPAAPTPWSTVVATRVAPPPSPDFPPQAASSPGSASSAPPAAARRSTSRRFPPPFPCSLLVALLIAASPLRFLVQHGTPSLRPPPRRSCRRRAS